MISEHIYTAVLVGSPDVELGVEGGSLSFDVSRAQHVQGQIMISAPGAVVLEALDPRDTPRVRVTAEATFPSGTQTRTFDLGLRDRSISQGDGSVELVLASDEALLGEYAPLADDTNAFAVESSLRDIVDYVLGVVLPGTTLEASPSVDADMTRYWRVTNLLTNPGFETGVAGWNTGAGASGLTQVPTSSPAPPQGSFAMRWTASAGDSNVIAASAPTVLAVTPGRSYVFSAYVVGPSRTTRAVIQWWSAGGAVLSSQSFGATLTPNNLAWQRVSIIATAPEGATHAYPYIGTVGNTGGEQFYADCAMFYEGDVLVPYFDGATTDTADYLYDWSNAAHGSTSTREPLNDRPREALVWKAGQSALDFLAPLVQVPGFRLVCDENRSWTLRDEGYSAPGTLSIRYEVNLIDGTDSISRDSGLWFDAAVTKYEWTDAQGIQQSRSDAYALVTPHTRLRTFEKKTAYPGPGFSEYAVRRAQGRGRELTVSTVNDWTANAEQPTAVMLAGSPKQVGNTQSVTFSLDNDRMTVVLRTLEIPDGAIDLLTGTVNALTGTVNAL